MTAGRVSAESPAPFKVSVVVARAGFRHPQSEQERKVLMPSCEQCKASESDFEALTTAMTTALRATSNEWTPLASDGGSEEKRSLTRPVGIRMEPQSGQEESFCEEQIKGQEVAYGVGHCNQRSAE